ncbi:hypothetical protein TSAR_006980 [Trichomalopsis sarcophagae]|uniref:Uncharacterized protein n=1 Tax=Trichomalopsis sarcophagae TaxID=543379 RepID=A0A232EY61_9HYME|nr:hypothetical protein TSAR_006980 [Trichomalopsis sarcophagae]
MNNIEGSSNTEKSNLLKPINLCNLVEFYIPLSGIVSYATLSVNIMNPTLR